MPRAREKRLRNRVGDQLTSLAPGKKRKKKRARSAGDRLEATLTQIRGSRGKSGRRKTVRR
jgi:hypothetical protein